MGVPRREGLRSAVKLVIVAALLPITNVYGGDDDRNTFYGELLEGIYVEKSICGKLIPIDGDSKVSLSYSNGGVIETITIEPSFAAVLLEPIFFGDGPNKVQNSAYASGMLEFESHIAQIPAGQSNAGVTPPDTQLVHEIQFGQTFSNSPIIFIFTLSTVDPVTDMTVVTVTRIGNERFTITLKKEGLIPARIRWVAIEAPSTRESIRTWQLVTSCMFRMIKESNTIWQQSVLLLGILDNLWELKSR